MGAAKLLPVERIQVLGKGTGVLVGMGLVAAMVVVALLARTEMAGVVVFILGGLIGGLVLSPLAGAPMPVLAAAATAAVDSLTAEINPGYSYPVLLLLWTALAAPGVLAALLAPALRRPLRRTSPAQGGAPGQNDESKSSQGEPPASQQQPHDETAAKH